jgi:transcriptional regulator with GAF, ATPase, and Fis domain
VTPKLIVINGDLKGSIIALTKGEVSIGRDPSNAVCLPDPAVSRRHCLISGDGKQFSVIDLGSFNRTIVNGVPIDEHLLEDRDQIAVGDTLFLFLADEDSTRWQNLVQFEDESPGLNSTIQLLREDAIYLKPDKLSRSLSVNERASHDLNALLKISTTVNSIRRLKPLQQQLLQLILEALPAERGAILLTGTNPGEVVSFSGLNKLTKGDETIKVSRTVVDQVLRDGVSILNNNVLETSAFGNAESLIASQTKSLLCAPLIFFENAIGAIYLSSSEAVRFDDDHLQLLTGIAGIAAVALENALHYEWVENENLQLLTELKVKHQIVGASVQMRKVYHFIAQVAPTDSIVLIRGESGTGKELAAHAIHLNSSRADKAFVIINCAAISDALFESEFFGHERGAFSGANAQKKGLLELADGGTLFLDEVGELSISSQAKLLRVLEDGEFRRVGGLKAIKVDVRIVAATNRDLEAAVREKSFRDDLYHRLNVLSFEMPPLRDREEDIVPLAHHFILQYNSKHGRRMIGISPEARERLLNYTWPGNIRELRNVIERAVVMERTDLLTTEFLSVATSKKEHIDKPTTVNIHDSMREAQKLAIIQAYGQSKGNYTKAARILGIHPNHLHRLIRILNLKDTLIKD